jgi:hypothetical protein
MGVGRLRRVTVFVTVNSREEGSRVPEYKPLQQDDPQLRVVVRVKEKPKRLQQLLCLFQARKAAWDQKAKKSYRNNLYVL